MLDQESNKLSTLFRLFGITKFTCPIWVVSDARDIPKSDSEGNVKGLVLYFEDIMTCAAESKVEMEDIDKASIK